MTVHFPFKAITAPYMFPLPTTVLSRPQFQQHRLLHFFFQIL